MSPADQIEEAKTVAELMTAINRVYHLNLPTSFAAGTDLAKLWDAAIVFEVVHEEGVLYLAVGTEPIPITVPAGKVRIEIGTVKNNKKETHQCHSRPKRNSRRARGAPH
jgi:hypothetical protein